MADFAAVLRKAIDALKENTPEAREKVYEKARATIEAKLAAVSPPPPPQLAERQRALLEEAVATVEAEFSAPAPQQSADDLDDLLATLNSPERTGAPSGKPEGNVNSSAWAPAAVRNDVEGPAVSERQDEIAARPQEDWSDLQAGARGDARAPVDGPESLAQEDPTLAERAPRARRRGVGGIISLLLILVVLGAAAAGGWFYRDDLAELAGFGSFDAAVAFLNGADEPQDTPQPVAAAPSNNEQQTPAAEEPAPADTSPQKFTQRLLPDGREVDEGPAGGAAGLGEGTSVAASTPGTTPPAQSGQQQAQGDNESGGEAAVAVGQRAIFYEEGTNSSQGSADNGSVVWSIVQESPGDNLPPEPAIRAEATIPEKGLQLKMTIRRNADESLPASHIVELIFLTPQDFSGGSINNVLRVAMKQNEQDTGSPLLGVPAKIADGFFLMALSDSRADAETNTTLMRRQSWIDIPIVYASGRRALMTLEKGVPGERVFTEALDAWQRATSG